MSRTAALPQTGPIPSIINAVNVATSASTSQATLEVALYIGEATFLKFARIILGNACFLIKIH